MCKPHWNRYTNALRKAAVARKAEEGGAAPEVIAAAAEPGEDPASGAPAHEHTLAASLVGEGEPIEAAAPRRSRRAKAPAGTEVDAA